MIGELLKLLGNIEKEVDGLVTHGDIPHDAYNDIVKWVDEAREIVKDYDR